MKIFLHVYSKDIFKDTKQLSLCYIEKTAVWLNQKSDLILVGLALFQQYFSY